MIKRLILSLVVVAGLTVFAGLDLYEYVSRPLPMAEPSLDYEIVPGTSFGRLSRDLADRGLIERPLYWQILARLQDRTGAIKAGNYRIQGPLNPAELLDLFVSGRTVQYSLTVPEGWTYRQLREALARDPNIRTTLAEDADVMALLGRPGVHPEGWFLPETYHFPKGTTDLEFLRRSHAAMQERLNTEWSKRAGDLPLDSPYEALILASVVEKETGLARERPLIAAVFISRLRKGMLLQTDPTVIYGMGDTYRGNIRARDLREDTPYNTYVHSGLPPTPIALPGADALHAALHPADSDALFFVARGDGGHVFSRTYDEHAAAVVKYQLGGRWDRYPKEARDPSERSQ